MTEILKAGMRFLGLAPRTLADIYTDIGIIAGIVDASGPWRAANIADAQRNRRHSAADGQSVAQTRLLRGMGEAAHHLPTLGSGAGGSAPEANLSANPASSFQRRRCSIAIRRSLSPPGAGQATGCRWQRSFASEAGAKLPPREHRRSTAFPTNS